MGAIGAFNGELLLLFFLGGGGRGGVGAGVTYFSFHKNTKKFMFGPFKNLGHYTEYLNLNQNDLKRTYAKMCCFTPISLLVQGKGQPRIEKIK